MNIQKKTILNSKNAYPYIASTRSRSHVISRFILAATVSERVNVAVVAILLPVGGTVNCTVFAVKIRRFSKSTN